MFGSEIRLVLGLWLGLVVGVLCWDWDGGQRDGEEGEKRARYVNDGARGGGRH